jgi:hypothetical protein
VHLYEDVLNGGLLLLAWGWDGMCCDSAGGWFMVAVIVNPTTIAGSWRSKVSGGLIHPDIVCCLCNTTTAAVVYSINQPTREMKIKYKGVEHLNHHFSF